MLFDVLLDGERDCTHLSDVDGWTVDWPDVPDVAIPRVSGGSTCCGNPLTIPMLAVERSVDLSKGGEPFTHSHWSRPSGVDTSFEVKLTERMSWIGRAICGILGLVIFEDERGRGKAV